MVFRASAYVAYLSLLSEVLMKEITCPICKSPINIPEKKLHKGGFTATCPKCHTPTKIMENYYDEIITFLVNVEMWKLSGVSSTLDDDFADNWLRIVECVPAKYIDGLKYKARQIAAKKYKPIEEENYYDDLESFSDNSIGNNIG